MPKSRPHQTEFAATRRNAALVLAGLLCALLAWVATARDSGHTPRFPFVWFDVAIVYFLAALPAGWLLAVSIRRRWSGLAAAAVSTLALAALLFFTRLPQLQPAVLVELDWPGAALLRAGLAMLVTTCAATISQTTLTLWKPGSATIRSDPGLARRSLLLLGTCLLAALVPAAYAQTRISYFQGKLAEYVGQNRLGDAQRLAAALRLLDPYTRLGPLSTSELSSQLDLQVRAIENQVAQPLPPGSSAGALLERAHKYAILGRVDDVERTLHPLVRRGTPHPAACLHLGTAYEAREDWQASLHWYQQARAGLLRLSSPPPAAMLVQATKGIAYTERKLGRYREAEAAYRQALALAPSAEMHFLLAQFYEDGQQTAQAHEHALAAARLEPARFAAPAQQLIGKLAVHHFGCMSVLARQNSAQNYQPAEPAPR